MATISEISVGTTFTPVGIESQIRYELTDAGVVAIDSHRHRSMPFDSAQFDGQDLEVLEDPDR